MVPYGACEPRSTTRSNAQFEAQGFRKGSCENESAVEYQEACSSSDFER